MSRPADSALRTVALGGDSTEYVAGGRTPGINLGHVEIVVTLILQAVGVLLVSAADIQSREGNGGYALFWAGLLVVLLPTVIVLCTRRADRCGRLLVATGFGMALFLIRVVYAPTYFVWGDEFAHFRTTLNLAQSGRLFGDNPVIVAAAHYPGLGLVTSAVSTVSGLSIFVSALIVLAVARLIIVTAIFTLVDRLSGSSVAAGLAVVVYSGNPNFLYWNTEFAYESLALPLVVAALLLVIERGGKPKAPFDTLAASLVIAAVVVTHHLSSFILGGILILLVLLSAFARHRGRDSSYIPLVPAGVAVGGAVFWLAFEARGTIGYLSPVFGRAARQAWQLATTGQASRVLFGGAEGGPVAPKWEQIASYAAVVVSIALLVPALWNIQRRPWPIAGRVLAWTAVLWVALLPLRLTQYGQEMANRSTEFAFLGLALAIGTLLAGWLTIDDLRARVAVPIAVMVIFVGGVAMSFNFNLRMSPQLASSASPLAPTPDDHVGALWFLSQFGSGQRIATDSVTRGAFASVGEQHTLSGVNDGAELWQVFYPTSMSPAVYREIRRSRIQFIVLQDRLVGTRPPGGTVFDASDPQEDATRPILRASFAKFRGAPGFHLVYRSGELEIYRLATSLWGG